MIEPICSSPGFAWSANVFMVDGWGWHKNSMHSFQPRIDGLTKTVTIEVSPDEKATAHVLFEEAPVESPELTQTITAEPPEAESLFITASLESMLEDFIANNLTALEPGLQLFKDEDGIPGRQCLPEVGPIDLLCVDSNNNLVVIELKRGRESDKVVGQISRYIGWVKGKLAKHSRDVRGIIVVHEPTRNAPRIHGSSMPLWLTRRLNSDTMRLA